MNSSIFPNESPVGSSVIGAPPTGIGSSVIGAPPTGIGSSVIGAPPTVIGSSVIGAPLYNNNNNDTSPVSTG